MEDENSDTEDHVVRFAVSIATDRDQFLRLTCSECGRDFKTEVDPEDFQWALASQCLRMGLEVGGDDSGVEQPKIRCPYCGHWDPKAEMQTAETVEYLKRVVYREYLLPQVNRMFSGLEDSLGRGGGGSGMFSISMSIEHDRSISPARPFHGPEPADMKIIDFTCCRRRAKVTDAWVAIEECCYCGQAVKLI